MVVLRIFWITCLIFLSPFILWAQDVKVTADVDQNNEMIENHPLKVTIMVTHDASLKVDPASFRLEGAPIKVDFISDTTVSSAANLIISIYQYEMKGQPQGLHALPPISVNVGGNTYQSISNTYVIMQASTSPGSQGTSTPQSTPTPQSSPSSQSGLAESTLQFEAFAEGNMPLYPGQRARLVYRFLFSGSIELTKEYLPMLDPKGLRKIGDTVVKDYNQGLLSVHDISQEIEADKPGEFSFGPSIVEGKSYVEDQYGNRIYSKTILHAEAPAVIIIVKAMPGNEKPASYNGAIGKFSFTVSLASPSEVNVGDKMTLSIDISGQGVLENVPLPDICCQPGFSGLFKLNDLPPVGQIQGTTKHFLVDLRPLSSEIKEIPSIEFSFFDPATKKYTVLHSPSIPIKVNPLEGGTPSREEIKTVSKSTEANKEAIPQPQLNTKPSLNEIEGIYVLHRSNLRNKPFGTWWVLFLVPLSIAFLWYQDKLRIYLLKKRSLHKPESSAELFAKALQTPRESSLFYHLLYRAFFMRLVERKELDNLEIAPEDLPVAGEPGKVRELLLDIEERRFSGKGGFEEDMLPRVEYLFRQLNT